MSTPNTTEPRVSLTQRLRAVQQEIREARDERTEAEADRQRLAEEFSQSGASGTAGFRESPEFKKAKAAADRKQEIQARLDSLHDDERAILSVLGQDDGAGGGGNGPEDVSAVEHADDVKRLVSTPGAVLSTILSRRRADVPTLPDHLRFGTGPSAAQLAPITTGNVTVRTESDAVIDLLSPRSVALASGIQVLRIDGTKTDIPRFTELPEADWIPELGAFPRNGPGIEMVESEPPKVGLVTRLSLEAFEDLRPITLAMLQTQLFRAIALAFDRGVLFGTGAGAQPIGVFNTSGIPVIQGVPLNSLAAFAQALAVLIGFNARPGALAMNPLDIGTLLSITESAEGAGSNVPLWKASVDSASGLRLPYFSTPIWPTPACPQGNALLYDPDTIVVVLRRDADIAIDPYYGFDNGEVGLRTYLRGEPVVGQIDGAVRIEFEPPAP